MDEELWRFVDAAGTWASRSYGLPPMTGRVLGWLLVCDPPEQTAAQVADAVDASKGSISSAINILVRARLVERLHVRGERAERIRLRPEAWDDQVRFDPGSEEARSLVARGLEALKAEPPSRRARLEELDAFYDWWQQRAPRLYDEWMQYKREHVGGTGNG